MRKRTLALLAIFGLVVLAGCSGDTTDTETPIETDGTPTETPATPQATDTSTETDTPTETETAEETTDQEDQSALQADVVAAMESVETYHLASNTSIVQQANNQQQEQMIDSDGVFDRTTESMQVNQTISASGMSQNVSTYLQDGTFYEYSPSYASQYDSEWVTLDSDPGFFDQQDTLARQQTFFANASVTTAGTETIDGVETQVLDADVNESATTEEIAARLGTTDQDVEYNVTSVEQRLWADTETNRPQQAAFSMNANVTQAGETVDMKMEIQMRFTYDGDVSITLPDGADSAVSIE